MCGNYGCSSGSKWFYSCSRCHPKMWWQQRLRGYLTLVFLACSRAEIFPLSPERFAQIGLSKGNNTALRKVLKENKINRNEGKKERTSDFLFILAALLSPSEDTGSTAGSHTARVGLSAFPAPAEISAIGKQRSAEIPAVIARTEPGASARQQPAYFSFYRKQQKADVRRFFLFPIEARFSPGPSGRGFPAVYARSADRLQALLGGTPTTARRGSGPPSPHGPTALPRSPRNCCGRRNRAPAAPYLGRRAGQRRPGSPGL